MKKLLFLMMTGLILLILMPAAPILAQGPGGDTGEAGRVVFGSNLTLEDGDLIDGDVVVFGGNFVMESGSEVKGDVVVFGGNVTIGGKVKGDIAGIGGNVDVKESAQVKGDVVSLGGKISIDESAEISGAVTEGPEFKFNNDGFSIQLPTLPDLSKTPEAPQTPAVPQTPAPPPSPRAEVRPESRDTFVRQAGRFIGDGVEDIFAALIIAGLSLLVALFFPAHVKTIHQTVVDAAPVSLALGAVTMLAALALTFLLGLFFWLILPICGIVLVALAMAAALLAGMAVIGKFIGARIFAALNKPDATDLSAVLLGVALLVLVIRMPFVDHLPWIGWMFGFTGGLIGFITGSIGLGAVVLSRFGTQPYHSGSWPALTPVQPAPAPPAPPEPPEA